MSWKFEAYWSGAWHELTVWNYNDLVLKKTKSENFIFGRIMIDGKLQFHDDDFTSLYIWYNANTQELDCRFTNSTDTIIAKLSLFGTWNIAEKICQLPFSSDDGYNLVLNDYMTEQNIIYAGSDPNWIFEYCILFTYGSDYVITRNRLLTDCIKELVRLSDPSILFDGTSFAELTSIDSHWESLMLCGITDLVFTAGLEPFDQQVKCKISLEEVMTFLRIHFNIYWYVDNTKTFKLIYKPNYIVGNGFDATNFQGRDWCDDLQIFNQDKETIYSRIQRDGNIARNLDFIGVDIIFPNLVGKTPAITRSYNNFYTDFENLVAVQGEDYSMSSLSTFILLQTKAKTIIEGVYLDTVSEEGVGHPALTKSYNVSTKELVLNNTGLVDITTTIAVSTELASYSMNKGTSYHFKVVVYLDPFSTVNLRIGQHGDGANFYACSPQWVTLNYGDNTGDLLLKSKSSNKFHVFLDIFIASGETIRIQGEDLFPSPHAEWFTENTTYEIESTKILDTVNHLNAYVSQAYIDSVCQLIEQPDILANINGVDVAVARKKNKIHIQIPLPIILPSEMDFDKTVTTHLGEADPIELSIPMNGAPATFIGVV